MRKIIISCFFISLLLSSAIHAEEEEGCHIVYGMLDSFPPFEWLDEYGQPQGMLIDFLKLLSNEAGCSYEIVSGTYFELLEKIKTGEINMKWYSRFLEYEDDPELEYIRSFVSLDISQRRFYSHVNSPPINTMEDIRGKTVVVMRGAGSNMLAERLKDKYDLNILTFRSVDEAILNLSRGIGDFAMFSTRIMDSIIPDNDIPNIKRTGEPMFPEIFELVLNKDDIERFVLLEQAVQQLKLNGKYYDLLRKWFRQDDYSWLYKAITSVLTVAIGVILMIILWNRSLRYQIVMNTEKINSINAENMKLREEAATKNRLAALGEMATSVAHDINNPTGLIMHNMTFLQKLNKELLDYADEQGAKQRFCMMPLKDAKAEAEASDNTINECLDRIANTVTELKNYGKPHNVSKNQIDLRDSFQTAIKLTNYFTRRYTNNISLNLPDEPVIISGRALYIEEAIINLIQNACYALGDNGWICCTLTTDGDHALISIEDNGCGMDAETIDKACNAFFTTRADSGGTGLGLPITSRIVKEHSGQLNIKSEKGQGTEVNILLPLA